MNVSKNQTKMLLRLGVVLLFVVSLSQPCWADAYKIEKNVLNGGIQGIGSDAYSAWSSVGQSVTGNMQGGKYVLMGGFWSAFTYFVAGDANNDGYNAQKVLLFFHRGERCKYHVKYESRCGLTKPLC